MISYPEYAHGGPNNHPYPPSSRPYVPGPSVSTLGTDKITEVDSRQLSRTPSPTPSEADELLKPSFFDWKAYRNWRFWFRKEWAWYYVIAIIVAVVAALVSIYHKQIVDGLTPAANWIHNLRFGWLIPIAIFFVISFPPLFGHEIIAILCGVVWGLWIGFGIVAAGTFLGELGNFYAFKYCCRVRGEKLERTQISYACLAKVVRDGGFKVALIARLSVIPGHFTTAVFATCGMSVFTFSLAAILSLPKQFITVYLGVILEQSGDGTETTHDRIVSDVVLALTALITILAMWYILHKMNQVKPDVIYARRKARQGKLARSAYPGPYASSAAFGSSSTVAFNPRSSETEIPLNAAGSRPSYEYSGQSQHQQWDDQGRAIGYAGDPRSYPVQPPRRSTLDNSGSPSLHTPKANYPGGYVPNGGAITPEEVGVTYPMNEGVRDRDGRSPIRQESDDTVVGRTQIQGQIPGGFNSPSRRIAPPSDLHEDLYNPYKEASTDYTPPGAPSLSAPRSTQAQYITAQHQEHVADRNLTSPPLSTPPFASTTLPTQQPPSTTVEPYTPRVYSPPPPTYRTNNPER